MATPKTLQAKKDHEAWQNVSRSRFVLKKLNSRGEIVEQMVAGRQTFHLSPEERVMNMELAASAAMDPFSNGMFAPVRLIDGTEDLEEIAANPNLISETDMVVLVKGKIDPLRSRLEEIQNPIVINRLLEVAYEQDSTVGKIDAIKGRLQTLQPAQFTEIQAPQL